MGLETLQYVWLSAGVLAGLIVGVIVGRILFSRLCPEKPSKVFAELQKMQEEMEGEEEEEEEQEEVVTKQPDKSFPKGGYIKNGRFVPNKVPVYKKDKKDKRRRSKQYEPGGDEADSEVEPIRGNEYPAIVDETPPNSRPNSRQRAANISKPDSRSRQRAPTWQEKSEAEALTDVSNRSNDTLLPTRARKGDKHGGKKAKSKATAVQPVPANPTQSGGASSKTALPVPTVIKKKVYQPRTTQALEREEGGEPEDKGGVMSSISEMKQQRFNAAKAKAAKEAKEKREMDKMQQQVQESYGKIAAKNNRTLGEFKPGQGKAASLDNYKPPSYAAAKARSSGQAKAAAHAEIASQRLAAGSKKKKGKKR
jgi:hypothetical protein